MDSKASVASTEQASSAQDLTHSIKAVRLLLFGPLLDHSLNGGTPESTKRGSSVFLCVCLCVSLVIFSERKSVSLLELTSLCTRLKFQRIQKIYRFWLKSTAFGGKITNLQMFAFNDCLR